MVSQDHDLFAASLLENILYGDKDLFEAGYGHSSGTRERNVQLDDYPSMKNSINSDVVDHYENFDSFGTAPPLIEDLVAEKFEKVNSVLTALATGDPLPGDCIQVRRFYYNRMRVSHLSVDGRRYDESCRESKRFGLHKQASCTYSTTWRGWKR